MPTAQAGGGRGALNAWPAWWSAAAFSFAMGGCGGLPPDTQNVNDDDAAGDAGGGDSPLDAAGTAPRGDAGAPDGDGTASRTLPDGALPPTIALAGCPSSGYAASFTVGGQPFDLIVDTGSGDLAVASNSCPSCAAANVSPVYTPGATAVDQGRQVTSQYGIGTWTGELFSDDVALKNTGLSTSMRFVAIESQAQFFSPSGCNFGAVAFAPQGIAGFGPSALASPRTDVFMSQVAAAGLVPALFAVELCPIGGQLWVGGYDAQAAAIAGPTVYTPLTASGFYSVALDDLQLGGQSLGFGAGDFGTTVVDTGTTSIALPPAVLDAVASAISANHVFATSFLGASGNWLAAQGSQSNCFASSLSSADLDAMLPGLTLVMPGESGDMLSVALTATESYLQPSQFMMNGANTTFYCSGLLTNTAKTATTILGVAGMSAHLVVFDAAGMRVGFAPQTHCR